MGDSAKWQSWTAATVGDSSIPPADATPLSDVSTARTNAYDSSDSRNRSCSFAQRVGIRPDGSTSPSTSQLSRSLRHTGGGSDPLHHPLSERIRTRGNCSQRPWNRPQCRRVHSPTGFGVPCPLPHPGATPRYTRGASPMLQRAFASKISSGSRALTSTRMTTLGCSLVLDLANRLSADARFDGLPEIATPIEGLPTTKGSRPIDRPPPPRARSHCDPRHARGSHGPVAPR